MENAWTTLKQASRDPDFVAILGEIFDIKERKSADYAPGDDPYANFKMSESIGIPAWLGAAVRRMDKWARQKAYITKGSLTNESFEDALLDDIVYCIIELKLWREANK